MSIEYFIRRRGRVFGPFQASELRKLAQSGKLVTSDDIARDRDGPWTASKNVPTLFNERHPNPKPEASADPSADRLSASSHTAACLTPSAAAPAPRPFADRNPSSSVAPPGSLDARAIATPQVSRGQAPAATQVGRASDFVFETITIPLSKRKLFWGVLLSALMSAACIWLLLAFNFERQHRYDPNELRGITIGGLVFFAFCALYCIYKSLDQRPGLIVDAHGIVDNSSALAVGRIPWSEVLRIEIVEVTPKHGARQRFVSIATSDFQKYLNRGNPLARLARRANLKLVDSAIIIGAGTLQLDFDELHRLLTDALKSYNRTRPRHAAS